MTRRRPACSAVWSRPVPSWPAATFAERDGSITNTVVSGVTNTQSHQRWFSLSATSSNTCQEVSSQCACPACRPRAAIACAHGASSGATCLSSPARVPEAISSPSAASAATIRCTGRPSTYFSCSSPGQEPGSEQPLRHHLGRLLRAGRLLPAAPAAAPVAAAPQEDPDQLDLPVDQLAVLGADELVPGPAARAAPLLRFQVDDAFPGLQVRITAPAVPRGARTLPPFARTMRPSARAVLAGAAAARGRSALFAGGAEQQPAQRRDRLLQPAHLGGQRGHPGVQLRIFLPQPHGRRLSPLGPGTPAGEISAAVDHLRGGHASPAHITAVRLSRTKPGVSQIPPHQPGSCAAARPPSAGSATSATRVHRLLTLPE